jgi:hypothetical protein
MSLPNTYTGLVETIQSWLDREDDDSLSDQIPTFILFGQRRIARELKILGLQAYAVGTFTAESGVVTKPNRWLQTLSVNWGSGQRTITAVEVDDGGEGYTSPPAVTFSGGGGSGAEAYAFVVNGAVTQIAVTNPGAGYTSIPTVTLSGGGGSGATATAIRSAANTTRNILLPRSYEFCRSYWPDPITTATPKFYADYGFTHWLIAPTPPDDSPIEIAYYEMAQPIDASNQTNWLTANAPDLLLYACLLESAPFLRSDERLAIWQAQYDRAAKGYSDENRGRITDRATTRNA